MKKMISKQLILLVFFTILLLLAVYVKVKFPTVSSNFIQPKIVGYSFWMLFVIFSTIIYYKYIEIEDVSTKLFMWVVWILSNFLILTYATIPFRLMFWALLH